MDDHDIDAEHDVLKDVAPAANVGDGVVWLLVKMNEYHRQPCWKHITKKEVIEDGVIHYFAVCNYCQRELSAGSGSGTGHLNRHYKACLARLGQTRGGDSPIMLGESLNFKNLIQRAFCPQYQPVTRRTTKSDLFSLYEKKLAALKEDFKKVQFSFALTSDIWTSSHQKLVMFLLLTTTWMILML
ncbi:hypothetical protein U9M48_012522 [Paspalum notatum var. saurae]|uniref:BED-type domain-containing protein n=1 Tax=Paspalum notatum var. saurae TaxID=547442 RepID=A0AAQ3SZT0_PASNO